MESRWTLIRDEQGRPRSFLIINTDVTEKRTLEKEAHRAQRMETIGELAGGMAHDLNNALAPILMGVQLLRREEKDEHILRILSLIENNTHRGADMVRQVLFFARGREGESQALDLRSHIHEIERLIRETFTKNLSIHVQIAEDLWSVQGQPTQIHQILLNLCVNARDAMPHGGSLSIAADNVSFDADQSAAIPDSSPGEYVCLLVADTGTGISSELLPKIFDPFFTTKAEGQGTGLGLSTCARIAKSHGGFIRVESTPGEGTAFEVYLPRLKTASENLKPKTHVSAPRGNGETLLVVDDEDALRHVMRRSLEDYGYRVLVASNAAEALVQLNADNPSDIQLILCDLHMPGMNGAEFAIQLRQARPKLRVILMTGGATPAQSATSTPDLPYLTKPFDLDSALHRIAEVLKEKHDRG